MGAAEKAYREKDKLLLEAQTRLNEIENLQNSKVSDFKDVVDKLTEVTFDLEDLQSRVASLNPKDITEEIEKVQTIIQKNEDTIRETNPKIQSINADLNSQDRVKRGIIENLNMRKLNEELNVTLDRLEDTKRDLGATDFQKVINKFMKRYDNS